MSKWKDDWYKNYGTNKQDNKRGSGTYSTKGKGLGVRSDGSPLEYEWTVYYNNSKASESSVEAYKNLAKQILSGLPEDYKPTMQDHAYDIVDEAVDILISKHEDYGPLNISNAPGGPLNGLAVRLHDKVSRLGNLTQTGNTPNHETLRDTFIDIINYAVIGILVSEGHWE